MAVRFRLLTALLALLLGSVGSAKAQGAGYVDLYRCDSDKGPAFQNTPCAPGQKQTLVSRTKASKGSASAEETPNETKAAIANNCKEEWPMDFRMQAHCIERQIEAAKELKALFAAHAAAEGSPQFIAMGQCAGKWKKGKTYDFVMVKYCYDKQMEGLQAVQASGG